MSKNNGSFLINNITKNDVRCKQLRIIVENKIYFPTEIGEPRKYILKIFYENEGKMEEYLAKFTIGHKDFSRSGILKIGKILYVDILKIKDGDTIKMTHRGGQEFLIEKL